MSIPDHSSARLMLENRRVYPYPSPPDCDHWVYRVSLERWPKGYAIARDAKRPNCPVFCLVQGEARVDCGDGEERISDGACFCFAPGRPHWVVIESKEAVVNRLTIGGRGAPAFVSQYLGTSAGVVRCDSIGEIRGWYRRIFDEADSMRADSQAMVELMAPTLLFAMRRGSLESKESLSSGVRLVQQARSRIRDADPASLTVTGLARACCCSPEHLARSFRRHSDTTPLTCILRRRMEEADRLLTTTDQTLASIAAACGYADEFSFSKAFKRSFGYPPSQWRRQ